TVPTTTPSANPLPVSPFTIGIASGDPDTTSVVLWTRLLGDLPNEQTVVWEVAGDERFTKLAAAGVVTASVDDAHAIHVVAENLTPDTVYWYRFTADAHTSPVGRTRTTPDGEGDHMRFAFASCQDWQDGLYTAHAHLAEEDVDLVVWLGDYIYENGPARTAIRTHDTPEVTSLEDYRRRYALYKGDPALQAAHARAPWFVTGGDHEVDNNYAGTTPEVVAPKVDFVARRAAAYRAWWEHQPTRLPRPEEDGVLTAYRALVWGGLATFVGLDGRQYRDDQPCARTSDVGAGCADRDRDDRTMLGAEQERWVDRTLTRSKSAWNVLANQTIFTPSAVRLGNQELFNLDQWDGYPAARQRMLDVLVRTSNPVVVTGDIHASAVSDVKRGDAVVTSELVGASMTSSLSAGLDVLFEAAAAASGAKFADAHHHGYVMCDVSLDALRADYRIVSTTTEPTATIATSSSWEIAAGAPGIRRLP
ncbi:MAG: alkaline phosphatase, partial [Actinomycetota bacterium]|nr:alkaline phosphatase [Actinomycetota bacterium]